MPEPVLLDNDVALKVACYSLTAETLAVTTNGDASPGMLGVGRFVIRNRLDRDTRVVDVSKAREALERLLEAVQFFEPTADELALAADLEGEARGRNLELDSGESQLLAIIAKRNLPVLITGDKRAIAAMAVVASAIAARRVVCLEQLFTLIADTFGVDVVRPRVCAEPHVDRAISSCFACASHAVGRDDVAEGLTSYIGHLDRSAPGILLHTFGQR